MTTNLSLFRLNVGFIVHQSVGYSRNFPIEIDEISTTDDLDFYDLQGTVTVSRTTEGLLLQFKGRAHIETECVLCLESFDQPLMLDFIEMFTFPSHADESTELILPDDLNIDLFPLIREYLYLDIPINPTCQPNCKGLCPICGENLNEKTCNHDEELSDPRLSILKSLLDREST